MKLIEKELNSPNIWKNREKIKSLSKEKKRLEREIELFRDLEKKFEDLETLVELQKEGENIDEEFEKEFSDFER